MPSPGWPCVSQLEGKQAFLKCIAEVMQIEAAALPPCASALALPEPSWARYSRRTGAGAERVPCSVRPRRRPAPGWVDARASYAFAPADG